MNIFQSESKFFFNPIYIDNSSQKGKHSHSSNRIKTCTSAITHQMDLEEHLTNLLLHNLLALYSTLFEYWTSLLGQEGINPDPNQ